MTGEDYGTPVRAPIKKASAWQRSLGKRRSRRRRPQAS